MTQAQRLAWRREPPMGSGAPTTVPRQHQSFLGVSAQDVQCQSQQPSFSPLSDL